MFCLRRDRGSNEDLGIGLLDLIRDIVIAAV